MNQPEAITSLQQALDPSQAIKKCTKLVQITSPAHKLSSAQLSSVEVPITSITHRHKERLELETKLVHVPSHPSFVHSSAHATAHSTVKTMDTMQDNIVSMVLDM